MAVAVAATAEAARYSLMPTEKGKAANGGLPFSWRFHVADRELNARAVEAFF